jgi:PBP1b-binding outer membrane lipoprotein LpoB
VVSFLYKGFNIMANKLHYVVRHTSRVNALSFCISSQAKKIGYSAAIRQAKNKGFSFELVLAAVRTGRIQATR